MRKINSVILDVGGVLVQTWETAGRQKWEKKLQLSPGQLTKEVYEMQPGELATIGQIPDEKIWENIRHKFALTQEDLAQLKLDFYAGDKLNTKLYSYLRQIHKDFTIVLLSNAWLNSRKIYSKKYHLDKISDSMIISAEEGMRKPDKQIYLLTLDRMSKKPDEAFFIDDNIANIQAAKALGMHTILFTKTDDVIEEMKKMLK